MAMVLTIVCWYWGIGFAALASLSIYRTWVKPSDAPGNIYATIEEDSWKQRVANVFLYPLAIVLVFIPLWPLAVSIEFGFPWHKLKFWKPKADRTVPESWEPEPEFKVSQSDLLEKLSRGEIEAREEVHDPLQAVPNLPFGHLNSVWQAFADGLEPDCELWSFRGRWKTEYRDYQMQGYVAQRGETIGPYFLTAQRATPL